MCLNLYDYQFKVSRYSYGSTYLKNRVTTNQKHTVDSQKPKRREYKHNTTEKSSKHKKEPKKKKTKTMNKMAISTYLSIITLNVNGLNVPLKRHRVAEWIQKQDPYICCLQETHFRSKDTHRL